MKTSILLGANNDYLPYKKGSQEQAKDTSFIEKKS